MYICRIGLCAISNNSLSEILDKQVLIRLILSGIFPRTPFSRCYRKSVNSLFGCLFAKKKRRTLRPNYDICLLNCQIQKLDSSHYFRRLFSIQAINTRQMSSSSIERISRKSRFVFCLFLFVIQTYDLIPFMMFFHSA